MTQVPHLHTVAMAGGSGTRFWPLSRRSRPKQLMPLGSDTSLLAATFERVAPVVPSERRWMVIGAAHEQGCRAAAPSVAPEHVLVEPRARNTAAAIALAAIHIRAVDPDGVMAVFAADHHIRDVPVFAGAVAEAARIAAQGPIVTLGVRPSRPETGYGYIQRGAPDARGGHTVARFCEKPDAETAKRFAAAGCYDWNAGIFIMRVDSFWAELERQLPGHHRAFERLARDPGALAAVYDELESISVDYGVMESAADVVVVPIDCGWSDVGSFAALRDVWESDDTGTVSVGRVLSLHSKNCIVYSDDRHVVAVLGCDDLAVVHTGDATLVVPADRAQDVREIVAELEARGWRDVL